jgi:hypothetical protein
MGRSWTRRLGFVVSAPPSRAERGKASQIACDNVSRRVWVRAVRGDDGVTVVEMAGLGRAESAKLPEELAELAVTLNAQAPTAPEPVEVPAEGAEK